MKGLRKKNFIEILRETLEQDEDVILAYLFGSMVIKDRIIHDIDLAILFKSKNRLESIANVIKTVSRALGISEEKVDIVDLKQADLHLKYRILTQGIKLIDKENLEDKLKTELSERYSLMREELSTLINRWLAEDPAINKESILRKLDEVLRNVSMIKERYLGKNKSWLLSDLERAYAFERAFHRTIESMLDICRHIVSVKRLGIPQYYSEYPIRIAEVGLINKELARKVSELARLRNILIHQYVQLDYDRLLEKAEELARNIVPDFTEWLRKLISKRA